MGSANHFGRGKILMFGDLSLAKRIPAMIVTLAVATAMVTGIVAYIQTSRLLQEAAEQKLIALLDSREIALEALLADISGSLEFQRDNPTIVQILQGFQTGWSQLNARANANAVLQDLYVNNNPHPPSARINLANADDGSTYSSVHGLFHPNAIRFARSRGLEELFLFDSRGNLLYSVRKNLDFATNFNTGPWAETGLGQAFQMARDNPHSDFIAFQDFAPYAPNQNVPAGFLAAPVLDSTGALLGVLAYQLSPDRISAIMHVTAGMGETGETYLVGEEMFMRSDSRFSETSTILQTVVNTNPVHLALSGEHGVMFTPDYRGVPVLSAYSPFSFLGVRWALLAEIDEAEILEPLRALRISLFWVVIVTAIVISTIGAMIAVNIARPLIEMKDAVLRLANDDLSVVIPGADSADEVGEIRRALNIFRENAMRRIGAEMRIRHLANHDELTGLPTRRLAKDRLKTALLSGKRHGWRVAVMFIDLDGFKAINDKFGHDGGDALLAEVAARLKSCLRASDTVARIGGDEFLAIITEFHDESVATWVVQKLLASLDEPVMIDGQRADIGASIGVALYPDHGEDVEDLIRSADQAMYEVKHSGKNGYRIAS